MSTNNSQTSTLSILIHIPLLVFVASYTLQTLLPALLAIYRSVPYLLNTRCTQTLFSLLSLPVHPYLEFGCSIGLETVNFSLNTLIIDQITYRTVARQAANSVVAAWCDYPSPQVWGALFGRGKCHLALGYGSLQVGVPRAWTPSLQGIMVFFVYSWAVGYLRQWYRF